MLPFIISLCLAGFFGGMATVPFWADHAAVWMLRTFHIFLFPDAIRLAVSLERDTAEWEFGNYEVRHPKIGTVWIGHDVLGIRVKIDEVTEWRPNWIERRIIWQAVNLAINRRIHEHLHRTLPA
jgi:hypothetical protein